MIRAYSGISLDGFSAMPDGLPAWDAMPTFSPDSYGLPGLKRDRAAIVIGRTSFDQGFQLERLELCVLPIQLGTGIPMFDIETDAFSTKDWAAAREHPSEISKKTMRLESHRAFPDGAVEVVYSMTDAAHAIQGEQK